MDRAFKSSGFLSTPEGEARFWGMVAVAIFLGIGAVIFASQPPEPSQVAMTLAGSSR
jgi:hypothetical protein